MADEDMVARMEALLAEKEKGKETVVGTVMKNGGGAVTGGLIGGAVVAPLAVWAVAAAAAPFTGGVSLGVAAAITAGTAVAGAVIGHKASKKVDD
jgi:hypothetical protein